MKSLTFQVEEISAKIIATLEFLTKEIGIEPEFNQNRYIHIEEHILHIHEGIVITHINHEHAVDATGSFIYNIDSAFENLEDLAAVAETMLAHAGETGAIKQIIKTKEVTAKASVRTVTYAPSGIIKNTPIFKQGDNETVTDIAALDSLLGEHDIEPSDTTITIHSQSKLNSIFCDVYDQVLFSDES